MGGLPEDLVVALAGMSGGLVLGVAVRAGRFCTLGAIEDMTYGGSTARACMWLLALSLAIAGTAAAQAGGITDIASSMYFSLAWNPAASVIGGLLFGYGMALAGCCGLTALARIGGGDIRAVVIVLVIGISAYMAIGGPTGYLRDLLFPPEPAQGDFASSISHGIGDMLGVSPLLVAAAAAVLGIAIVLVVRRDDFGWRDAAWSTAIAVAIVSGWILTGWLSERLFIDVPVESHTFAAPLGESLIFSMTSTGSSLSFGIGSVAGVVVGALAASLLRKEFRWEACEDPRELKRQIFGAFLMGTGGVVALGCSIGQGLTAFSALSASAPVTAISILVGARVGLYSLVEARIGAR